MLAYSVAAKYVIEKTLTLNHNYKNILLFKAFKSIDIDVQNI